MGKTVRIIGAGKYDTRGSDVAANIARDRRFINYMRRAVVDPDSGSGRLVYEKRPGWTSTGTEITGTSASWSVARSFLRNSRYGGRGYVLGAGNFYTGTTVVDVVYGTTSLGQITPGGGTTVLDVFQTEAQTSGGLHHLIQLTTGTAFGAATNLAYYFTPTSATASGALTQITDGDFPTNGAGPLTQKWGYVFYGDELGNAWNSDANSITAWTAASYFPCNAVPDRGRGVWSNGTDLLACFGSKHIELLYNASVNVLSPLKRADGGVIEMGLHSSSSICEASGGLAFIGQHPDSGSLGVYLLSGTSMVKLSTPSIDQYMHTFTSGSFKARLCSFDLLGEPILLVQISSTLGTTVLALACTLRDQYWFEWDFSASSPIWPVGANKYNTTIECMSGGNGNRYLYTMDDVTPAYTDYGQAYTATMQTGRTDFGTGDTKTLNWLELIGDTSGSGDAHIVSISTDDAQNFTQVGSIDMSGRNRRIHSLGSFSDLFIRVTHSTATASRIEAIDANVVKWGH